MATVHVHSKITTNSAVSVPFQNECIYHICRSQDSCKPLCSRDDSAASIFHTVDFMGGHFVGLVMSAVHRLHMLGCEAHSDEETIKKSLVLGTSSTELPGTQVVSLPGAATMVVFDAVNKELLVYSGTVRVRIIKLII